MRIFLVVILLLSLMSFSTKDYEKRGDRYLKVLNYERALKEYLRVYRKEKNNPDILSKIAYCYLSGNQLKGQAIPYLEKLYELKPNNRDVLYDLARAHFHAHHFDIASEYLDKIEKRASESRAGNSDNVTRLRQFIKNAKVYTSEPEVVDLINLGDKINTTRSELSPFVTFDESILYYSSDKRYSSYSRVYYFNVCVSELDGDSWGKYKMIGASVNSGFDEIVAGVNPTGNDVFVFHNRYGDEVISYTRYKGRYRFDLLSDFGHPIDMRGGEYGVYMTENRDTLFYAAEGEAGSTDLFYSIKLPNGDWGESRLLPGKINSEYDENFPVFMPDENRLYFSSNNEASMGGYDLFYSTLNTATGEWGEPVNMGYPISDTYDNYSISWVKGKRICYISAIRPEGIGNRDIYKVVYVAKDPSDVIYRCSLKVQADSGLIEPWFTPEINVYDTLQLKVGTYSLAMDSARFIMALPPGDYYLKIDAPEINSFVDTISVPERLYKHVARKRTFILSQPEK